MARSRRRGRGRARRRGRGRFRSRRRSNNVSRRGLIASRGWGETIASGIRSLLGYLPAGKALKSFFDFGWKSFSKAKAVEISNNSIVSSETYIFGLSGSVGIKLANIVASSQFGSIAVSSDVRHVLLPFRDGRLVHLNITASPANIIGKRSGEWILGFMPFRHANDQTIIDNQFPTYENMTRWPGSVSGPADRPLVVNFRPKITDGKIFTYQALDETVGAVVIAFKDINRVKHKDFTAEDFSVTLKISGGVALRSQYPDQEMVNYSDNVKDYLSQIALYIESPSGCFAVEDSIGYKQQEKDSYFMVSGKILDPGMNEIVSGMEIIP